VNPGLEKSRQPTLHAGKYRPADARRNAKGGPEKGRRSGIRQMSVDDSPGFGDFPARIVLDLVEMPELSQLRLPMANAPENMRKFRQATPVAGRSAGGA
jgi:hypothetical protein